MTRPGPTATARPEVPTELARLAELVAAGNFRAARRAAASLLGHADPHTLGVVARCADALQADRDTATAALDELWLAANDTDSAIITACIPGPDYVPDLPTPDPEPAWKRQVRWVPPSPVKVRRGPVTATPGDTQGSVTYLAEPETPGADVRDADGALSGYELDYDLAALQPMRGTPCVSCWIERSAADQHRRGCDDGLCLECRDAGHRGIPDLPVGHTRADAIRARCQFIADADTTGQGGLPALRAEYRRANAADRAMITAWVRTRQT